MSFIFNFGIPGLMEAFGPGLQSKIKKLGIVQRYDDRQHIQSRGDKTQGFSIIKSGAVCFGKADSEGRFITTAVLEPGQCYGEFTIFAGLPRTHDAYAEGGTEIIHISKARFDQLLLEEPEVATSIISLLTMRVHHLLEWIDDHRRYPLAYRLGKNILLMAPDANQNFIKITQSELADLMGVSRVAIAQTLAKYKKLGFLLTVYGGIKVQDPVAMARWLKSYEIVEPVRPLQPMFSEDHSV